MFIVPLHRPPYHMKKPSKCNTNIFKNNIDFIFP